MQMKLLYTQDEAAELLHMPPRTLSALRVSGAGPRYYRVNRRVSYRLADLEAFIAQHVYSSVREVDAPLDDLGDELSGDCGV